MPLLLLSSERISFSHSIRNFIHIKTENTYNCISILFRPCIHFIFIHMARNRETSQPKLWRFWLLLLYLWHILLHFAITYDCWLFFNWTGKNAMHRVSEPVHIDIIIIIEMFSIPEHGSRHSEIIIENYFSVTFYCTLLFKRRSNTSNARTRAIRTKNHSDRCIRDVFNSSKNHFSHFVVDKIDWLLSCHKSIYRDFEKVVGGPLIHTDFVQSFRLMRFGVKRFFKFTYTIFFALIETLERSMKYSAMPNLHVFFIDLNLVALKFSEFT